MEPLHKIIEGRGAVRTAAPAQDFGTLAGAMWDSRCLPTNFDGLYERNGHFLAIECKQPGESLSIGQRRMLVEFKYLNPLKVTVVVVRLDGSKYAETGAWVFNPIEWQFVETDKRIEDDVYTPVTLEQFRQFVRAWEHLTYPEDVREFNAHPYGTNLARATEVAWLD